MAQTTALSAPMAVPPAMTDLTQYDALLGTCYDHQIGIPSPGLNVLLSYLVHHDRCYPRIITCSTLALAIA